MKLRAWCLLLGLTLSVIGTAAWGQSAGQPESGGTEAGIEQQPSGKWFGSYDVRIESDSTPGYELGLPFGITVPSGPLLALFPGYPSDTRQYLLLSAGYDAGPWRAYGALLQIGYSMEPYADTYDVSAIVLGGYRDFKRSDSSAIRLGYAFTDLNLGGVNYNQSHTIASAYRTSGDDGEGGTRTMSWGLDLALKQFADASQDSAADLRMRYELLHEFANKLDHSYLVVALGSSSEGFPESEFMFVGVDYDWSNRWESGPLWDVGLGLAVRMYPDDIPLTGDTRMDIPLRASTGLGWQFRDSLRAMGNLYALRVASNGVSFTKVVISVGLNGTF